jgi:hypothetical protein
MDDKPEAKVNVEVLRELRNDFTFFVAMSVLKSMAVSVPDPKTFIKDVIWKWRELQVSAMGALMSNSENKLFSDPDFNELFGEMMKKITRSQRESLVSSIRLFCESLEKVLISSFDDEGGEKEENGFTG